MIASGPSRVSGNSCGGRGVWKDGDALVVRARKLRKDDATPNRTGGSIPDWHRQNVTLHFCIVGSFRAGECAAWCASNRLPSYQSVVAGDIIVSFPGQSELATDTHSAALLRGRPPFAPFALDAAALACDLLRPPRLPVAAAKRRAPKARSTKSGTWISTANSSHDNASPEGEMLIASRLEAGA